MSQLTELVAMEAQIAELRERIQQSYSGIEFADYEIKDFVSAMVANIQEPECLQALVRLEQIATENYISLGDIAVGVALPQTNQLLFVQDMLIHTTQMSLKQIIMNWILILL